METGNLIHLGAELVVQMLMLYSTSPHARRLTSEMLTGDAFNIDVKLDDNSTNRNVEILNVYLKTMGLKLTFKKNLKKKVNPWYIEPLEYFTPEPVDPMGTIHPDEVYDIKAECERILRESRYERPFIIEPMELIDKDAITEF